MAWVLECYSIDHIDDGTTTSRNENPLQEKVHELEVHGNAVTVVRPDEVDGHEPILERLGDDARVWLGSRVALDVEHLKDRTRSGMKSRDVLAELVPLEEVQQTLALVDTFVTRRGQRRVELLQVSNLELVQDLVRQANAISLSHDAVDVLDVASLLIRSNVLTRELRAVLAANLLE